MFTLILGPSSECAHFGSTEPKTQSRLLCHDMSPKDGYKWSNGVGKSDMSIINVTQTNKDPQALK